MTRRRSGLSRKSTVYYGEDVVVKGIATNKVVKSKSRTKEKWSMEQAAYENLMKGLSVASRDLLRAEQERDEDIHMQDIFDDPGPSGHHHDNANDFEEDLDSQIIPYGEEGMGGEFEYYNLLTSILEHSDRRADSRSRTKRVEDQVNAWKKQEPRLVDAYLVFRAHGVPQNTTNSETWRVRVMSFTECGYRELFHTGNSETANESLTRHGFIGGSAEQPTIAFALSLFEIYRQIHRICPHFSIYALAYTLQNLHHLPVGEHLEDQLRTAYDAYLSILREVQARSIEALGRTQIEIFQTMLCSPCMYKLDDEQRLVPSMLFAIDGNTVLKMVDPAFKAGKKRLDTRHLGHYRMLEESQVNEFANEVQNAQRKRNKHDPPPPVSPDPTINRDGANVAWLNVTEMDELAACIDTCVERWKAAAPESRKQMFALFGISGIFLATCRHGHVVVMCDMIRSGELMKYPLAIIDALIDHYGEDLGVAYDIMCAFYKTLLRSVKLRNKVLGKRLVGVVPSFHGHAHNRKCQVSWHPQYIHGVGLEDFETCERLFSQSNNLASSTRFATAFHRHQIIQEHFDFNDEDKHAASGTFIYHNYRQATERLSTDHALLEECYQQMNLSPADCEGFLNAEREHFTKDFSDPPEVTCVLDYAELLQKFWATKKESDEARKKFQMLSTPEGQRWSEQERRKVEVRNSTTFKRYEAALEQLVDFQVEHNLDEWSDSDQRYLDALRGLTERKYRRALEQLEHLVVQRLFELTKLNMSDVGYKQRQKITNALKSRATAIRCALQEFNTVANQLEKNQLEFDEILDLVSIAGFDLLKDSHIDITQLAWTKAENRKVMLLYFGVKHYTLAIQDAKNGDLAAELQSQLECRNVVHMRISERLVQTSKLAGFTGTLLPGQRVGWDPHVSDSIPLPKWATSVLRIRRESDANCTLAKDDDMRHGAEYILGDELDVLNDELQADGLIRFMENLALEDAHGQPYSDTF
ncbi:hypothetical protein Moror_6664 [Moniliophthora roreri MCA 2997]|uniref:CxC1-like cysteine cluster associated with KDZ transposases domain-containing protein n=1 Tax=Moniliophthora roreri (strain MCA 2997) TaxID=1381753 RepID=V2XSR3_MONRO|nr:hypothetical protein Moror_6664 [Moniliophthora roreri MCA 2997]